MQFNSLRGKTIIMFKRYFLKKHKRIRKSVSALFDRGAEGEVRKEFPGTLCFNFLNLRSYKK
jgi:hypothetical protein